MSLTFMMAMKIHRSSMSHTIPIFCLVIYPGQDFNLTSHKLSFQLQMKPLSPGIVDSERLKLTSGLCLCGRPYSMNRPCYNGDPSVLTGLWGMKVGMHATRTLRNGV